MRGGRLGTSHCPACRVACSLVLLLKLLLWAESSMPQHAGSHNAKTLLKLSCVACKASANYIMSVLPSFSTSSRFGDVSGRQDDAAVGGILLQVVEKVCKAAQKQARIYQESIRDMSELEDTTGVELYQGRDSGKARSMIAIKTEKIERAKWVPVSCLWTSILVQSCFAKPCTPRSERALSVQLLPRCLLFSIWQATAQAVQFMCKTRMWAAKPCRKLASCFRPSGTRALDES